jgi:cyclophilin family peptidyl-prolyl cis-trans isomerase
MDVVDAIATVSTTNRAGHSDVPEEVIVINSAKVI